MRNRLKIGIGVGIAALAACAIWFLRLSESNEMAFDGAKKENQPEPVASNMAVEPKPQSPLTSLSTAEPAVPERRQTDYSTGRIDEHADLSSDRRLLASPLGEDQERLIKSLRLTKEDSEKLLDILVDETKRTQEWRVAKHRSFMTQEEADTFRAESDPSARALLGDVKFRQYDDYRNHRAERKPIDRLNERLMDSNNGVLPQQIDDLLYAAMKEEASRTTPPLASAFASQSEYQVAYRKWREENLNRFLERAKAFLTFEQLAQLKTVVR